MLKHDGSNRLRLGSLTFLSGTLPAEGPSLKDHSRTATGGDRGLVPLNSLRGDCGRWATQARHQSRIDRHFRGSEYVEQVPFDAYEDTTPVKVIGRVGCGDSQGPCNLDGIPRCN